MYCYNYGSEPFNTFNTAISNTVKATAESQNQNNITITFENTLNWSSVYIYLWYNSSTNSGWTGHTMEYNDSLGKYAITFNLVDEDADNYLSFVPKHLIFHNNDGAQTIDVNATLISGYRYNFKSLTTQDGGKYKCERTDSTDIIFYDVENKISDTNDVHIYLWNQGSSSNNGWPGQKMTYLGNNKYKLEFKGNFDPYGYILTKGNGDKLIDTSDKSFERVLKYGWTYEFTYAKNGGSTTVYSATNPTRKALSTSGKVCVYDNPLYFGCYYRTTQISGTYADDFKPDGVSSYTNIDFGGPYRNFWWQANLGQKSTGDGTGNNSVDVRGHAAVQGLVDQTLKSELKYPNQAASASNPTVLKLTQNNVELPYFSYDFQSTHSNMMKIYDNSGNGIDFPFYEILAPATEVRGDVTEGDDTARFYQFNSKDTNLQFNTTEQYFTETNVKINNSNFPHQNTRKRR